MNRSPLDQLIAAEREAPPEPRREQASLGWRRLERSLVAGNAAPFDLPPSTVAPVAAATSWLGVPVKYLLATVLAAGSIVTAVVVTSASTEPSAPAPDPRPSAIATAVEKPEPAVAPAPVAPAPVQPAPVAPVPVAPAPVEPSESSSPARAASPSAKRPRAVDPSRPAKVPPSEPIAPRGIGRELELIKDATAAVQRRAHTRALDILATHAREFPSGTLSEDRQALRAIALCGAGRGDAGVRAAATFRVEFPKSVHAERVAAACLPKK